MKMDQQQQHVEMTLFSRLYVFLRDRDARIIELFFLALNIYVFALIALPPYTTQGMSLMWRILFQLLIVMANVLALAQNVKNIRIFSSIANASIMGLIAMSLIRTNSPHTGTYALLTLLAVFVTWKINIKAET